MEPLAQEELSLGEAVFPTATLNSVINLDRFPQGLLVWFGFKKCLTLKGSKQTTAQEQTYMKNT